MKSPFKFLDPFVLADKDVFFGRQEEVDDLYRMVYQTNLLLVYGYSGTGKTSLIQCGLAGRFDGPEWYPFFIRKGEDINQSTRHALLEALDEEALDDFSLTDLVEEVLDEFLSPVYLIFDQFEELFILGTPAERQQFTESIKELLNRKLSCKVIFVLREEYLGELYELERAIPKLFDFKLRVEPMNNLKVKEVLNSSFGAFNVGLEEPREEALETIVSNISGEKSLIQLPYLQVYLDMLWREEYERSYGKAENPPAPESRPELSLTQQEISEFGTIDGVLQRFLIQQEELIAAEFKGKDKLDQATIRAVLDVFVTEEGTKRPIPFDMVKDQVVVPPRIAERFPLTNPALTKCLQLLENSRILRVREESYELAHDSLANLIDEERSEEQKRFNRIRQEIRVLYQTGQFMNEKLLIAYADDIPRLGLDEELTRFIAKSEEQVQARKDGEKRARQRLLIFAVAASLVALVAIGASIFAIRNANRAAVAEEGLAQELDKNQRQSLDRGIEAARALKNVEQYDAALVQLDSLQELAQQLKNEARVNELRDRWQQLQERIPLADSLVQLDNSQTENLLQWPTALRLYREARELEDDPINQGRLDAKINELATDIKIKADEFWERGLNMCKFVDFAYARELFEIAVQLDGERYEMPGGC